MIGEHVGFVLPPDRVDQEIETPVGVLHLHQEIGLPFRLLKHVRDAVSALGGPEVVRPVEARHVVEGEDQIVDQRGAVNSILAVVAGVMVAARDVDRPLPREGEELGRLASQHGGGLGRVVGTRLARVGRHLGPRECKPGIRLGRWNLRGRDVTGVMNEARIGKLHREAASLPVDAEGVGPGESHRDPLVDEERQGGAEAGDGDAELPGCGEVAEVGHEDPLIGGG